MYIFIKQGEYVKFITLANIGADIKRFISELRVASMYLSSTEYQKGAQA